jgi:hypothetical protein
MSEKTRSIGPYSHPVSLAKLDGRTREATFLGRVRAELTEHVGKPSVVQRMLINRAAVLSLRLAMLDQKIIRDQALTEHDNNHIVAWQNALTRILVALGVRAEAAPSLFLNDLFGDAA